jgi:hypothetical protein
MSIPFPKDEIPFPPRALVFAIPGTFPVVYLHRKVERPGHCYWCLGQFHPGSDCTKEHWCRCCSGYLPDMLNGGAKHACQFNMEAAPSCPMSMSKGKGKGKGAPPANTSTEFKAHKNTQLQRREAFKRKMEEGRVQRLNESKAKKAKNV